MYFIRWTPLTITKKDFFNYLKLSFDEVLVSEEYSKRDKRHFHALVYTATIQTLTKDALREKMYADLLEEGQKKGVCTLDIKIPPPEDLDLVATYTVKDNDFLHTIGFADKMHQYISNSYTKSTPSEQIKLKIEQSLEDEHPDFYQLAWDITEIKADAGHGIYPSKIEATVLGVMIQHNKNEIDTKVLSRFKIFSSQ